MEQRKLLGKILVEYGFCTRAQIKYIEELKMAGDDRKMGEILVDLKIITPMQLSIALAKQRNLNHEHTS